MKRKLLLFSMVALSSAIVNAQYCEGGGPSYTSDTDFAGATLVGESSSISWTNSCPGVTGHQLELGEMADLTIGATYTANLNWGTCGGSYYNGGNAWIDFDGSGTFDPDEIIATRPYGYGATSGSYTFTVPGDAIPGETRMRVVQRESASPPLDPCASFSWGSSMDFAIEINPDCYELAIDVSGYEICEGDMLTLDATSETGGTITWTGGAPDGVPFDPGLDGIYEYYVSSDSEDDCVVEEPVVVEVIGLPAVIAGAGDLNFCEDESITLATGGDAEYYEWNDGDELDLTPGPGEYTFTLTGYYLTGACPGENVDEVTVTVHELPTISATASDDMICIGNEVTMNGEGGATYMWDMGVTDGVSFSPNTIGTTTYTVTGWDEFGCEGMGTVDVEVVEDITISLNALTLETEGDDAGIDINVSGGAPTYTFDWDNDGTGDFDDDEDLTGVPDGFYTVVVMGAAGCEASALYEVGSQLSIDENETQVSVYPNPTSDLIQINMEGNFQYELVSINGEILISGTAVDKEELSLEQFADGVYFVNVLSGDHTSTLKVIKK
jgi:hypothetical protein